MKKTKIFLLLALSATFALAGCGKQETPTRPSDIVESIGNSTDDASSESEEAVTPDVDPNEPPAEGMVRSFVTNEWVTAEVADGRPIAVMFPTDRAAQPQYGISYAGILYECMEEGGMSRQMGIVEDWRDLEKIGNIRSCRDYYAYWCMEWDAVLVHWGGPFYLVEALKKNGMDYLSAVAIGVGEVSAPAKGANAFFRSDGVAPHNGYTSGANITAAIDSAGYEQNHRDKYYNPNHFTFAPVDAPNTLENAKGSFEAATIDLSKVFTTTKTSLEYDSETGTYKKYLYGEPQVDAATGEQLTFANIIVQDTYWEYRQDNKYLIFRVHDSGRTGYYFTQGRGIRITWEKESDFSPTKYYDMDGNEIQLNEGHTFIAVSQADREVIYK